MRCASKRTHETNPMSKVAPQISSMRLPMSQTSKWSNAIFIVTFWGMLFTALYVFFRYVQPITPWDGDDWNTVMAMMAWKGGPYPEVGSGYFFPQMLGTLAGFLAGFVFYPITGDYILAYATVGAILKSGTILLSLAVLYVLFRQFTGRQRYAIYGILFFLLSSFLIFRTKGASVYLFWGYNYCTLAFYELPNFLASAMVIYLLLRHIFDPVFHWNIKTGFIILCLYCLNYSFLPAAFLLSGLSVSVVISTYFNCRNIKNTCRNCWIYMLNWPLFLVELYCEFKRTFGTGYFQTPVSFPAKLKASINFFLSTILQYNKLFLIISIVMLSASFLLYFSIKLHRTICEVDRIFAKTASVLLMCILLMVVFFILFGAIDLGHVVRGDLIRMDALYSLYFLLIVQISLCLCYLLKKIEVLQSISPILFFLMFFIIVSPKYSYKSSIYDSDISRNIPILTTKVMREVVREIQEREEKGVTSLIVHVPVSYGGYNGGACAYPLYRHHVTDHLCTIEFRYEPEINEVFFE